MRIRGRGSKRYIWLIGLLVLFAGAATASYTYLQYRAIPLEVSATISQPPFTVPPAQPLAWPTYGQSAVASKEYGVLATNGDMAPQPTASTAKLITLLSIMTKRPFTDGQGGTITFTGEDVARYNAYVAGNGTVTPVVAGVQWTQYQAMQAIQIDSANNVSDSLAIWAFGSLEEYRASTQDMVERLGMHHTTIGTDASGYSPTTTSTAHDMAILMTHILDNPTLRDIIGQSTATLPWTGVIDGHSRIDREGFIGGKTGYIPEAGGTYVLAGEQTIDGHRHEIITAILGAPHFPYAQRDAWTLYESAKANFSYQTILTGRQRIGTYRPSWAEEIPVTSGDTVEMFIWGGMSPKAAIGVHDLSPNNQSQVGDITISYGNWSTTAPLVVDDVLTMPPWWYGLK